ncbi:MAG: GNAT family N-acetyltransferase [Fibrobacteres bacterium]|jgi:GNAT superfamily N-acetyltransferase|nr:GNAT family N-acetyltransferase [Fibrobacterota bacterium]
MISIKPVTRARWKDLEALFESPGAPKYCWCMVWRATKEEAKHTDGKSRKGFLKARVEAGTPVGLLAYAGKEPVAWCSAAPKSTYRKLDDLHPDEDASRIWSIACFFVKKEWRGQGLTERLVDAASALARKQKAIALEAYPVDEDSPSYRFMGFVPLFAERGFAGIGRAGSRRHVMRLEL